MSVSDGGDSDTPGSVRTLLVSVPLRVVRIDGTESNREPRILSDRPVRTPPRRARAVRRRLPGALLAIDLQLPHKDLSLALRPYPASCPSPTSKVLVINDEPLILRELLKGLNAAARSLDNPFGITFVGALTAREGLALIERDGDIQIVIVDDKLYAVPETAESGNGRKADSKRNLQMSALKLVQKITALRPELDIYILIEKEKEDQVVDALFAEAVDGYFYREERDYRGMYRILNAQIAERARTPFYDALKAYVMSAKDAWHTPGHSSGDSMRGSPWVNEFYDFMGEHVFDADLSVSVKALDSLMEPTGVIAEAQQMAAKAFGARRTFFATNGTSTANKVILQTADRPRREAAARPQLPQVGAPRRRAVRRAAGLPRLVGEPQVRRVRPGAEEDDPAPRSRSTRTRSCWC